MEMNFNLIGEKRKKLVHTISELTGIEAKYLGMPSCAYQVGDVNIDRIGTVTVNNPQVGEELLNKLYALGFIPENQTENEKENYELTVTIAKDSLTDEELKRLEQLLSAKGTLIKKALGINNFPIECTKEHIRFPWFIGMDLSTEEVHAYSHFIAALCNMAKKQKRISSKEKPIENEKYAFRCFLLRLGFIGEEYKSTRKILLKNLEGSSAFKGGISDENS